MTTIDSTVYREVLVIAEDYFGPASPRLMNRMITNHLGKDPLTITRRDIKRLSTWARLAVAMVTEDETVIEEFIGRLRSLADRQQSKAL